MGVYTKDKKTSWHEDGALKDMASQAQSLADAVVGHRIVKVGMADSQAGYSNGGLALTLDTGRVVTMEPASDCCAHSKLRAFIHNAETVDHVITKVVTDDEFEKWYILADLQQVLALDLAWTEGNYPYYAFGFYIEVKEEA